MQPRSIFGFVRVTTPFGVLCGTVQASPICPGMLACDVTHYPCTGSTADRGMKWLVVQIADLYEILFHPDRWMARRKPPRKGPLIPRDLIFRR